MTKQGTVHMSLSLAGLLGNWGYWQNLFVYGGPNQPADQAELREYFQELVADGVKVLPYDGTPCEGWSDQTGCPDHHVDEPPPLAPTIARTSA